MNSALEWARSRLRHGFPVFLEPHVLGLCVCLLLGDFTWILLPNVACQWHTRAPPCASWVSALTHSNLPILNQELCAKTGGRGTAKRLCEEWLGNDTKSRGPKVKYITSLLNVDRALTHLEVMVYTYCLRFWNSVNPAKYSTSLKSSLFVLTVSG